MNANAETGSVAPMTQEHLKVICEMHWKKFRGDAESRLQNDFDRIFGSSTNRGGNHEQ